MSLVPLLVNLAREMDDYNFNAIRDVDYDDDFGFGIHPSEIFRPRSITSMMIHPRRRFSPYDRQLLPTRGRRGIAVAGAGNDDANQNLALSTIGKDGFQVCINVSHFKPNELTVKTVNNFIVVEGNHEEREDDHGMIKRHFVRKYQLPDGFDPKDVASTISSDGVLTIKAPPPSKSSKSNERVVQIQQTGPAHLNVRNTVADDAHSNAKLNEAQNGDVKTAKK